MWFVVRGKIIFPLTINHSEAYHKPRINMLLAKKKNMTQVFGGDKLVTPVTVLDYSECYLQVGQKKSGKYLCIGKKKHPSKAEIGVYGEGNVPEDSKPSDKSVESLPELNEGDVVTISGTSKGKGFAGVMRMWNFQGGKRTHGQSDRQRHPGSIGAGTTPGRVWKGKKMGRRKGGEQVTVKGYKVIAIDAENKLLTVKGSVPGTYNSIVEIIKQ